MILYFRTLVYRLEVRGRGLIAFRGDKGLFLFFIVCRPALGPHPAPYTVSTRRSLLGAKATAAWS